MFSRITLATASGIVEVALPRITVVVGPNGSGKSLLLDELRNGAEWGFPMLQKLLRGFVVGGTADTWVRRLRPRLQSGSLDDLSSTKDVNLRLKNGGRVIKPHNFFEALAEGELQDRDPNTVGHLGKTLALHLTGSGRFELVASQPRGNLRDWPQSPLRRVWDDPRLREEVRRIVHDTFGKHLVVDALDGEHLTLRLSERPPTDTYEEQALDQRAIAFHDAATPVTNVGDGIKAFIGVVLAVLASDLALLLVDEPEAFLHPPTAHRLGFELARSTAETTCVFSTHSSDFLAGVLAGATDVGVIRLGYAQQRASVCVLEPTRLRDIVKDPRLMSAGVLDALFYRGAIVTEGDADRVFYEEINRRLRRKQKGARDTIFLNVNGKASVFRVVDGLRALGVRAAGIVDIDILKDGGTPFNTALDAGGVAAESREPLRAQRHDANEAFKRLQKNMKCAGGVAALDAAGRASADALFDALDDHGIFAVRSGELENWLPGLHAEGHKNAWLDRILDALGSEPGSPEYVEAGAGDVWDFIDKIAQWIDT